MQTFSVKQQTAAMRSPHDMFVAGSLASEPAGHVAGCCVHFPDWVVHSGGVIFPHRPSGWTMKPDLQMQMPPKHWPANDDMVMSELQP